MIAFVAVLLGLLVAYAVAAAVFHALRFVAYSFDATWTDVGMVWVATACGAIVAMIAMTAVVC